MSWPTWWTDSITKPRVELSAIRQPPIHGCQEVKETLRFHNLAFASCDTGHLLKYQESSSILAASTRSEGHMEGGHIEEVVIIGSTSLELQHYSLVPRLYYSPVSWSLKNSENGCFLEKDWCRSMLIWAAAFASKSRTAAFWCFSPGASKNIY